MEKVLRILWSEHKPEKILSACKMALKEMKIHKARLLRSPSLKWKEAFVEQLESCFFTVFLSNLKYLDVLRLVVDSLIALMDVYTQVKIRLAAKGIFFNIQDLVLNYASEGEDQKNYLITGYRLAIALTDNCPKTLRFLSDAGIVASVMDSITTHRLDEEIIVHCFQQISIMISYDMTDDAEILELQRMWLLQLHGNKIDLDPTTACILTMMNKFINTGEDLQLFGLRCLNSFAKLDEGAEEIFYFGGLDTACHAVTVFKENDLIAIEAFTLITEIINVISHEEIDFKVNQLCEVISFAMQLSKTKSKQVGAICDCLMTLLLVGSGVGKHLCKHDLPQILFDTLACSLDSLQSDSAISHHSNLAQCLFMVLFNPEDDISYVAEKLPPVFFLRYLDLHVSDAKNLFRLYGGEPVNAMLLSAIKNSDVDSTLFALLFGANVNCSLVNSCKPITTACKSGSDTMVKKMVILLSTFQHIGLWMYRIEDIQTPLAVCISQHDDQITAALLWYLLKRDLNGVAEWNKCNLTRLKSEWLETVFTHYNDSSDYNVEDCFQFLSQSRSVQAGVAVVDAFSSLSACKNSNPRLANLLEIHFDRFQSSYSDNKCPMHKVKPSVQKQSQMKHDYDVDNEYESQPEFSADYQCPKCSSSPYRKFLQLSFDEETLLEESIHKIPVEICTCPVEFPPSHLPALDVKELQLSNNGLTCLDAFLNLSQPIRKRLSISVRRISALDNKLTEIPASFAQIFANLVELNLSRNQLISFPFHIFPCCPKLESLDLSDNLIQEKQRHLSHSSNSGANDAFYPSGEVPFQHGLKTLKLTSNALTEFPEWIFECFPQLVTLVLKKNSMTSFISSESLEAMVSAHKDILLNLKHLDMSQNQLRQFSIDLFCLAENLNHIDLSQNKLSEISLKDETFLSTSHLSVVDLSHNNLTVVPKFVYVLPKLKTLLLSHNGICAALDASMSWRTRKLSHLDLSYNDIADVSALATVLVKNWPATLKTLIISHNAIVELPASIGRLNALEVLDISDNHLRHLPDELGMLTNLHSFLIRDNELSLEETILNGRAQEICQFLYSRLKKSVPQDRVKLMLVGDPLAGKTTLLKSLLKSKRVRSFSGNSLADMWNSEPKHHVLLATVGVNVIEVKLKQGGRVYQLSVWDFAGQEEFYATHPCFISERAMYIAMYDASKGPQQLRTLKPWLTAIHSRATHCPVLVVGSHADLLDRLTREQSIGILKDEMQKMAGEEWFPRSARVGQVMHEVIDVRENSSSISALRAVIVDIISNASVQGHPLVGNMVPFSYVQLAELLKRKADEKPDFPVITFHELAGSLQNCHDLLYPEFDSSSELMLAVKYLHQTGFLLHFNDPRSRLQDYFFIQPAWLCQLLAQVVSMKENSSYKVPYIDKKGILSKKLFTQNFVSSQFNKNGLPESFLPQLFRLLENFEVMHRQDDDGYLVPSLLPLDKPEITLPVKQPHNKLIRYFSMIYTPMGLWPRLIARLLPLAGKLLRRNCSSRSPTPSTITTWRSGVYFEWKNFDSAPHPFLLIQSGSVAYDAAVHMNESEDGLDENSNEKGGNNSGMEVVVPRSHAGLTLLAQLVDHVTNLVEEWYPGLMRNDLLGRCLFRQFSPCFVCHDASLEVHQFCVSDLAESVLCNKNSILLSETTKYKVKSRSGVCLVYCPNHLETPVPLNLLAPEINLDDYDQSLRLEPKLLSFEASSRRLIGGGGFGAVYQASYDGVDVAIKTFRAPTPDKSYKMLRDELYVLAQHQHPSIISLKGFIPPAFSTPNLPLPLLAIEYAKLGCLGKLLSSMSKMSVQARKSALSPIIRHRIAYEVVDGLCFLHRQNVVYRDLKPDNILLTSLNPTSPTIAKITDYGISTVASPSGIPGATGTPGYSAPEVVNLKIAGKGRHDLFPYSLKCDIYSYGLVLHELAVGRSPWVDYVYEEHMSEKGSSNLPNQPDEIVMMGILPSPITSYPGACAWPYAQEIVKSCLKRNPEQRPSSCVIKSLLSRIESSCCRVTESIFSPDPLFSKPYGVPLPDSKSLLRRLSYKDKLTSSISIQTCNIDMFYACLEEDRTCSVMKITVDVEKGCVRSDDVWLPLDTGMTISCMVEISAAIFNHSPAPRKRLPSRSFSCKHVTENEPIIVAGTNEGHVIVMQSRNTEVKRHFSAGISCIHFHRFPVKKSTDTKGGCLVVALSDLSLVVLSLEQMIESYQKRLLDFVKLSSAVAKAIDSMDSFGSRLFAVSGNNIVILEVAESEPPVILEFISTKNPILKFALSSSHFYTSAVDSDEILAWQLGDCKHTKVLSTRSLLLKRGEPIHDLSMTVSALYLDSSYSALWVGLSSGHIFVFSELRFDVLAVFQRHLGPIQHIFMASDAARENEVIVCVGKGLRSISEELQVVDALLSPKDDSATPRMEKSSYYLTLWDADVPKQALALSAVLKSRKSMETHS